MDDPFYENFPNSNILNLSFSTMSERGDLDKPNKLSRLNKKEERGRVKKKEKLKANIILFEKSTTKSFFVFIFISTRQNAFTDRDKY